MSANREAKQYARSGAVLAKKFRDEIYPLSLFVDRELMGIPGVAVTPNLNNDNFDAVITFSGLRQKVFIEITVAKDGYDEALRMESLDKNGFVFLTGPVSKVGRRGSPDRVITVEPWFDDLDPRCDKHLSFVENAVRKKVGRRYGNNFLLLVVVDDYLAFSDESYHLKLNDFVTRNLLLPELDFMRLVVLGIGGRVFFNYELPRYAKSAL